jgi:hypothetical protein
MPSIRTKTLSQVRPSILEWLWELRLMRGTLALLDGDPEIGKSLITIDLAARLSRGGDLPDAAPAGRPHVTILLGAEDNTASVVRPRAEAAGADLDRVIVLDDEDRAPLSFPANIAELEELIRAHGADLVVIDPISAFLAPEAAANVDQCVRRALGPLAALAARTNCTILLVRHLRKDEGGRAIYRGLGSMGFIAAVRTGLFAARHPADPTLCVLAVTKSNAAVRGLTLGYRIRSDAEGRAVVEWTGPVELTADAANQSTEARLRMRDRAAAWLSAQLAAGPRKASELYAAAAEAGIPERTLERAKADLRVSSRRGYVKDKAAWYWFDAGSDWPKNAPFRRPGPCDELEMDPFTV